MDTNVADCIKPLDSNAQPLNVEGVQESVAEMSKELESLRVEQKHLLTTAQSLQPSLMDSLTAMCKSDRELRQAAANVKAAFEENSDLDKHLKPAYSALIERANPVSNELPVTRQRALKIKCATALRNIVIKSVVYAGMRIEYLQRKLMIQQEEMPSNILSPAEVLEILGILPTFKKPLVPNQQKSVKRITKPKVQQSVKRIIKPKPQRPVKAVRKKKNNS